MTLLALAAAVIVPSGASFTCTPTKVYDGPNLLAGICGICYTVSGARRCVNTLRALT